MAAFSCKFTVVGAIFHTIQWSKVPVGASGSSTIRTKLLVFGGISKKAKGGETLLPSQVYRFGINAWCSNAGLSIFINFLSIVSCLLTLVRQLCREFFLGIQDLAKVFEIPEGSSKIDWPAFVRYRL